MTIGRRTDWAWLWLTPLAFGVYYLKWLAPIHEQCHAAAVYFTGGEVVDFEWARIWFTGGNTKVIIFFGYYGEVWLYTIFVVFSKRLDGFWAGAMIAAAFTAYGSSDYARLGVMADVIHTITWIVLSGVCIALIFRHHGEEEAEQPTPAARLRR